MAVRDLRPMDHAAQDSDLTVDRPVRFAMRRTIPVSTVLRVRRRWLLVAIGLSVGLTACLPAYPTPIPTPGWSTYTIDDGAHSARVRVRSEATPPLRGLTNEHRRRYHFVFTPTTRYRITDPVQPDDQFDWNKLPGLSDCGDVDLSRNGYMFAWRWRLDTQPRRMELTAYANNDSVHLTPPEPIVTMTAEQVDARRPIHFDLWIHPNKAIYVFEITEDLHGETVTHRVTLPRECPNVRRSITKWASGFYFGGTSTAPKRIVGHMNERR